MNSTEMGFARYIFLVQLLVFACGGVTSGQSKDQRQIELPTIRIINAGWFPAELLKAPRPRSYNLNRAESQQDRHPDNDLRDSGLQKFIYWIKVRNLGDRLIRSLAWKYEFLSRDSVIDSLEFTSVASIKPLKSRTIYAEMFSPPARTLDVGLLYLNAVQPFRALAAIRSVVYDDISKKKQ